MTDKLSKLLKTLLAAFIMVTYLSTSSIGEIYAKFPVFENELVYSCVDHLRINGNTVFCIQLGLLFKEDGQYPEIYVYWDSLSESQRQAIQETSYYGCFDYSIGHPKKRNMK